MLKQEELALLRAIKGNPALLRELRKALAAKKTAKAWRFSSVMPPSPEPGAYHHRPPGRNRSPLREKRTPSLLVLSA
jgi:hypothetical protein